MKDYYSILGLPRYASEDEIREAYRRLAMRWHPDNNPLDESAERIMQDLNRAKEVLFDPEARAEYKRVLEMQDALTYENLLRIRRKYKDDKDEKTVEIDAIYPYRRARTIAMIVSIAILIGGIVYFNFSRDSSVRPADPLQSIIERHRQVVPSADAGSKPAAVTAETPEMAERLAATFSMMGDYKTAVQYWEYAVSHGEVHLPTVVSLSLGYIKLKDYPAAMSTVGKYAASPHDQLLIFTTLGDYFKSELQQFDADDAYRKAVQLAPNVDTTDPKIAEALRRAREGIVVK